MIFCSLNQRFQLIPNLQQTNGSDCGLFTLMFAIELTYGCDPNRAEFTIIPKEVAATRREIAIRFG